MNGLHAIFIPGNSGGGPRDNWFPSAKIALEKLGIRVVAEEFPDNDLAREHIWIPFIKKTLGADKNSILIGHSSGAIAAMRFAEHYPIHGSVLVGTYYTDLGDEKEKLSGYFSRPWNWERIKKNQQWIIEFASLDDPWIPINEPRFIHEKLETEYYEYTSQGHFGGDYKKLHFPELIAAIKKRVAVGK